MTNRDRMLDLNREAEDQTNRLRMMNRVANETQNTSNNIMRELGDQKEKINNQINMVLSYSSRVIKSEGRSKLLTKKPERWTAGIFALNADFTS